MGLVHSRLSILFCSNSPRTPPDVTMGSVSLWWTRLVAHSMHSRWLIVIGLTKVLCLSLPNTQTCHANTDKARRHLLLFFYTYICIFSTFFNFFSRLIGPTPSVIKKHLKWVNYNIDGSWKRHIEWKNIYCTIIFIVLSCYHTPLYIDLHSYAFGCISTNLYKFFLHYMFFKKNILFSLIFIYENSTQLRKFSKGDEAISPVLGRH